MNTNKIDINIRLDILASKNRNDKILNSWIHSKDTFFNYFLVIQNENSIIIADKRNFKTYNYPKSIEEFEITYNKNKRIKNKDKLLLRIGNLKLVKSKCK